MLNCRYSLMVKYSNGNARLPVQFRVSAPFLMRKNMKKILLILLSIFLCACSSSVNLDKSQQVQINKTLEVSDDGSETIDLKNLPVHDQKYDVTIIGSGPSGLVAAVSAAQKDLKVLLVEQSSQIGGTLNIIKTPLIITNSQMQQDAKIKDSSTKLKEDLSILSKQTGNQMVDVFVDNVGQTINWLEKNGIKLDRKSSVLSSFQYSINRLAEIELSNAEIVSQFSKLLSQYKVDVFLNTKAIDFVVNEKGSVVGSALSQDGKEFIVKSKTLVIATGSYGKTLSKYVGELEPYCGLKPNDSNLLEKMFNFDLYPMDWSGRNLSLYGYAVNNQEFKLKDKAARNALLNGGAILINQNGERFVNELGSQSRFVESFGKDHNLSYYLLLDKAGLLAYNSVDNDNVKTYSDLSTLAADYKLNEVVIKATIDRYNQFVNEGVDKDFGRMNPYLKVFGDGEYGIVKMNVCYTHGLGGLITSKSMEVLNSKGKDIPGLFAIGGVVGGVFGQYGVDGGSLTWAFVSGYHVAKEIARMLNK